MEDCATCCDLSPYSGRKQGAHFRADFPGTEKEWHGKQIIHSTSGTAIRKTKGLGNYGHSAAETNADSFFQEDIGTGDATSQAIFSDQQCKARIIAKTDGVFAGEAVIREGWKLLHDDIRIRS